MGLVEASCAVGPSLPLMLSSLLDIAVTGEEHLLLLSTYLCRMSASNLGVVVGSHELYGEDPDQQAFAVREV